VILFYFNSSSIQCLLKYLIAVVLSFKLEFKEVELKCNEMYFIQMHGFLNNNNNKNDELHFKKFNNQCLISKFKYSGKLGVLLYLIN